MHAELEFVETRLPWNGQPVDCCAGLGTWLAERLPDELACLLPARTALFIDREVPHAEVDAFLADLPPRLHDELCTRVGRAAAIEAAGVIPAQAWLEFLRAPRDGQPWALYFSRDGGLGELTPRPDAARAAGVVPCSSRRNHGVAWARREHGLNVWLATARQPGQAWDFDSDVGHESAHAAFAPVPLFAQGVQDDADRARLASLASPDELQPAHVARLIYCYSELAVVLARGERRDTPSGTPVAEWDELLALLDLSEGLMPGLGFAAARRALGTSHGPLDVRADERVFTLARPLAQVVPTIGMLTRRVAPPPAEWLRTVASILTADSVTTVSPSPLS